MLGDAEVAMLCNAIDLVFARNLHAECPLLVALRPFVVPLRGSVVVAILLPILGHCRHCERNKCVNCCFTFFFALKIC